MPRCRSTSSDPDHAARQRREVERIAGTMRWHRANIGPTTVSCPHDPTATHKAGADRVGSRQRRLRGCWRNRTEVWLRLKVTSAPGITAASPAPTAPHGGSGPGLASRPETDRRAGGRDRAQPPQAASQVSAGPQGCKLTRRRSEAERRMPEGVGSRHRQGPAWGRAGSSRATALDGPEKGLRGCPSPAVLGARSGDPKRIAGIPF